MNTNKNEVNTLAVAGEQYVSRDGAISEIKKALKARSGKPWSVTGGRGTAWGWITVDAPPARRTAHWVQRTGSAGNPEDYENIDTGVAGGHITPAEAAELAQLMGLESVHHQGLSIPASSKFYAEHVARARGAAPTVKGEIYWD